MEDKKPELYLKPNIFIARKYRVIATLCLLCLLVSILCGCTGSSRTKSSAQHTFSVSAEQQIYFAPANLQYCPAADTWRFAENAYDTIGEDNRYASADYDGWIDLFAWGANGRAGIDPYRTVFDDASYGDGHNDIAGTLYDFSLPVNEQLGGEWRMFTHDEIHYLMMFRENAEQLFGYGSIDGIRGLFLLPDDWKCPEGITFTPAVKAGFENQYDWYYTIGDGENYNCNLFTKEDWAIIEQAGGVFLPAAGYRSEQDCYHVGISGHYWTSSHYGLLFANCLCLFEQDLFPEGNFNRSLGIAVRLVRSVDGDGSF